MSGNYAAGTSSAVGQAYSLAEWFKTGANPINPASSDYIIDDETIVCYDTDIPNRYSWGAGGSKYAKMSASQGGKYYGKCKNSNCINIEICSNKKNRKSLDANDTEWYFTDSGLADWRKSQKMFGYSIAEEITENEESSNCMYHVQVGAFRSKANAEAFPVTVRKVYPGAFIRVM